MPTASSLAWKTSSPKSQDAVALQQIKERGALPMIDRGDIRQAIDRCSNIWASLPGAGYGQFEQCADSLIAKFKEAGGTVREIDGRAESVMIISALVICIVCLSWAVNHYRDNAITYSSAAIKNARTEAGANAAITGHGDASAWCCCAHANINVKGELADAKAENDALRDDVAAGRRRLHIKAVCQSVREATTASGVDNAASPGLADTAERDWLYPLMERLITMQKQLEGNSEAHINEQEIEPAHIDGQLMQLLWAHTRSMEYKCLK